MKTAILKVKTLFYRLALSPQFIIEIDNRVVTKKMGTVKNSFLKNCRDIVEENNVAYGLIYAAKGQFGSLILKASSEIPPDVLQKFRNVWTF